MASTLPRIIAAAREARVPLNGMRLTLTNDEAYDLVVDVATGRLDDVPAIAVVLRAGTRRR